MMMPSKPPCKRLFIDTFPGRPDFFEAPTTAIDLGLKKYSKFFII